MIDETVRIETNDGILETFVCRPERGRSHPAILFLMDALGVREELKDMVRRLATAGYYVMLPNLYYRGVRGMANVQADAEQDPVERKRLLPSHFEMTIPRVMDDIGVIFSFLDRQPTVRTGHVGCHGYRMSGPYALAAAIRYPDRVAAAASFFGAPLISSDVEMSCCRSGGHRD